MGYGLTLVTAPTAEPTDTTEGKRFCRVDLSEDNQLVETLIRAARERCERITGRALVSQTWKLTLDGFGEEITGVTHWDCQLGQMVVTPPKQPLISVDSVKYRETTAGTLTTLAADQYQVDATSDPGRILPAYGCTWPTPRLMAAAVEIQFVCGYGAAAAVPSEIKARLWAYVSYCYRNRLEMDEEYLDSLFMRFWGGQL